MHPTDSARVVNGVLPPLDGPPLTTERWAEIFEVEEKTIREWIGEYRIPFKQFGRTRVIHPRDFWGSRQYANVVPPSEE